MKIAFLCKRRYTGKDALADRYGRLYELPKQLALLGHEVRVYCLDYHGHSPTQESQIELAQGSLLWRCGAIGGWRCLLAMAYLLQLRTQLGRFQPDVIIGASDIPHAALATWVSARLGVPCVLDLYDNFESFGQAKIPGFKWLLNKSLERSDLVLAVTHSLARKVNGGMRLRRPVVFLPNGVDPAVFHPGSCDDARARLGLPTGVKLVGTAGGLSRMKGLAVVYAAWQELTMRRDDVHLVLAGPIEAGFPPPNGERVHYLGNLPSHAVADLFRSLDVGVVPIADSDFGRYCFPQKVYEMLASELPLVVADVGEMQLLFSDIPGVLFPADDHVGLGKAIERQLLSPKGTDVPVKDWAVLAAELEPLLKNLCEQH